MSLVKIVDNVYEFPLTRAGYRSAIRSALSEKNYEMAFRLSHSFYAFFVKQLPPPLKISDSISHLKFEYYGLLADIYQQLELLPLANKMYHKMLMISSGHKFPKQKINNLLWMLGKNHFALSNNEASVLYMDRYFQSDLVRDEFFAAPDFSLEMIDAYENEFVETPDIKIVYPPSSVDYSGQLKQAAQSLSTGHTIEAIKMLSEVPLGSRFYTQAQNNLAVAYYMEGRFAKAIETALKVYLSDNTNIFTLCNLVAFYIASGNEVNAKKYANKLLACQTADAIENNKIAIAICELGWHTMVIEKIGLALKVEPYNAGYLLICAIANNNVGNFGEAIKVSERILLVDNANYLAKYIRETAKDNTSKAKDKAQKLGYALSLPKLEQEKRLKDVREILLIEQNEFDRAIAHETEVYDKIRWAFTGNTLDNSVSLQIACVDKLLLNSSNIYNIELARDLLLEPIHKEVQKRIVYNFVLEQRATAFCACDTIVKDFAIVFPNEYLDLSSTLREAYAIAYSTVVFILNEFEFDLFKAFSRVAKKLEGKSLKKVKAKVLAACTLYLSSHPVVKNIKANTDLFCDLFTVSKQDFFECLEYLNS